MSSLAEFELVMFGRPNISGYFMATDGWGGLGFTGPFWDEANCTGRTGAGSDGAESIGFDASRVTTIYGSSSTVQPASVRMLPVIKT